jgi:dolichol-phosphate mannosyltransferase
MKKRVIRYLVSGCVATATNIVFLYVFTEFFEVWYLVSAVIALILAFFVSFFLQKYWSFGDNSTDIIHKQMSIYLIVALVNAGINTVLMYILVDYIQLNYLLAQLIVSGLISVQSYVVYGRFIFKNRVDLRNISGAPARIRSQVSH